MKDVDWKAATDEAIDYLSKLVKFDTTNPPGDELECAQYVAELLAKEGIEPTVLESERKRGNVIARLKGDGSKKPLLLMSHLDVVHAEGSRWQVPPFSGEVKDGFIWGRGTLDTKQLTVMHLLAMFLLKRQDAPLKRDIIFMANADEETGGSKGAQWVVDNHFDKIDAEFALNEGGSAMNMKGKTLFSCANAEKGVAWMRLTALGRPGHGSMPHADNPTLHIARAINRLSKYRSPILVNETFRGFANALCKVDSRGHLLKFIGVPGLGRLLLKLVKQDFIKVMVQTTITPTVVRGGVKTNVIPDKCQLSLDARILPGVTRDQIEKLVLDLVDSDKIRLEFEAFTEASESPIDTEMFSILQEVVARNCPDAVVSPMMLPGGTDSRYVRVKGMPAYGFIPMILDWDDINSIHGDNEKLSLENLSFGVRMMFHIVARTCL